MERKKKIRIALVVILSSVFVVAIVGIGVRVDRARTLAVVKKLYSSEVYLNTKKKEALLFAPEALEKLNEERKNDPNIKFSDYDQYASEQDAKLEALGEEYETRSFKLLDKKETECSLEKVFKDCFGIELDIEEEYDITVSFEERRKYILQEGKQNSGSWSEWKTVVHYFTIYKVDGLWYCAYNEE